MKSTTEFSARSQRSFDEQYELENQLANLDHQIEGKKGNIAELQQRKTGMLKCAARGQSNSFGLGIVTDELRVAGQVLDSLEEHRAALAARLEDVITVTPEELKARSEQQAQLASLTTSRLESDRQIDGMVTALRQAIEFRADLTARMTKTADAIEFDAKGDALDAQRFDAFVSALPKDVSAASERWAAGFFGKQRDVKPYIVRVDCLAVRETLAHHGVYRFGETVELTDEQARELLRENIPARDYDPAFKSWACAPPSVVTVEAHEAALAEAEQKGVSVEQVYFWQDTERDQKTKAAGRAPQPANVSIGRAIDLVAEPTLTVRAKTTIGSGGKTVQAGDVLSLKRRDAAHLVESGAAERP